MVPRLRWEPPFELAGVRGDLQTNDLLAEFNTSAAMADAPASPFPFLHFVEKLKNIRRTGWVRRGIPNAESVSDHMYRMAVMTMLIPEVRSDLADIRV